MCVRELGNMRVLPDISKTFFEHYYEPVYGQNGNWPKQASAVKHILLVFVCYIHILCI